MAVLVTRPHPDGETTAASLRARGFAVLSAPMLRFEPLPFQLDKDENCSAVIATSSKLAQSSGRAIGVGMGQVSALRRLAAASRFTK